MADIRTATFAELSTRQLYALLTLRESVFVVEQACAYPELDGRDTEPGCVHRWIEHDGRPVAYLRTVVDPDGRTRIGRVVTAADHRGRGLAAELVADAVAAPGAFYLEAQADRSTWYERFGFTVAGPPFDDYGILHVPMTRS